MRTLNCIEVEAVAGGVVGEDLPIVWQGEGGSDYTAGTGDGGDSGAIFAGPAIPSPISDILKEIFRTVTGAISPTGGSTTEPPAGGAPRGLTP